MSKSTLIVIMTLIANLFCLLTFLQLPSLGITVHPALLIIIAVLSALSITYCGWVFDSRWSQKRLSILCDNISRMRTGETLNPRISGRDVVAKIDKAIFNVDTLLSNQRNSLEQSDNKTRTLIETVNLGIMIADSAGTILSINPRTQEVLGIRTEELVGKSVKTVFPELGAFMPFSNENPVHNVEVGLASKMPAVYLEITAKEFGKVRDGTWLISLTDISERKALERLKSEFMQMITHDLRAPLTSVILYIDMMNAGQYGELPAGAVHHASLVEKSCQHMVDMINSLLEVEKLEAGNITLYVEETELASLFERCIHSLSNMIEKKNLQVEVTGSEHTLWCDEQRISQVLTNLLSNAIKYSPKDGKIQLSAKKERGEIEIAVCDEGHGVKEEFREAVFERFYQIKGQSTTASSGLGLAICKELVKAHHGRIGVESNGGIGSRFWFVLPIKPAEEESKG
ncbi:MAG: PAS domain S-box protein [Candidatus Obscuribacterales bacterium]|nr:PAS domain S-box protein [Candidatus Obscuribacterales bacterium]